MKPGMKPGISWNLNWDLIHFHQHQDFCGSTTLGLRLNIYGKYELNYELNTA
jgi:hypothetical protein